MTDTVTEASRPGFEREIMPLFREKDRSSMLQRFDLWSYEDVRANQDAILNAIRSGNMPCDGPWPEDKVAVFSGWIDSGSLP